MLRFNIDNNLYVHARNNFNTSYVTVQHQNQILRYIAHNNFNTSYVTVQPLGGLVSNISRKNFNTSYVTVQRMVY